MIPDCLLTDVSHESCQVMQRWKSKKRRHCTVLFFPLPPTPSSPLKIRPPKQMPGLLSSERSARLGSAGWVPGGSVEGVLALNRGSLSEPDLPSLTVLLSHIASLQLKDNVSAVAPSLGCRTFPSREGWRWQQGDLCKQSPEVPSIDTKACATSQKGPAPA